MTEMTDRELAQIAYSMQERAYVPYSNYPVGAAILCADGTVFTGCNVENAAYGSSICAERTALLKAVSEGHRDDWVKIAVVTSGDDAGYPCGSCRQMLYEFAPDLKIIIGGKDKVLSTITLSELLPHGFGPSALD